MDIIYKVKSAINDGLTDLQIKKYLLKNIKSINFSNALLEDPDLIKNIFENRVIKIIEANFNNKNEIIKLLNNNLILNNSKCERKLKLIKFINSVNEYLEENNFIENYIKSKELNNNLNESLYNNLDEPKLILRPNQTKALNKNKENNFNSGVHIQVTGSGKSIIILKTIMDKLDYDIIINNNKKVYILLTERIEILYNWFFINGEINENNIIYWKNNNIIDLTRFEILDTIVTKNNNIMNKINNTNKHTFVIMNNAYLRLNYKNIKNNISLCIVDECHSISGPEIYKALKYIKYNLHTQIIGFSATPIRNTIKSIHQICDIFGKSNKLNILSLYDNIHALQDDIILPYKFIITSIKNKIDHKLIFKEIFKNEINKLPYKKIIAWCRKIDDIKDYIKYFKDNFIDLDIFYTHSKEKNNDIETFYKINNNAILLCVGRCREGCDIKNVDCGIYLDRVKKRSILVSQQCNGRIIRPDKEGNKKYGLIIENIYDTNETESIEFLTVQRLMSYYENIISLAENANEYNIIDIVEEFKTVYKNTIFSDEKKEIIIKVDNNNNHDIIIKIEIKDLNWSLMKKFLNDKIIEKINNENNKLNLEFELLKTDIQKLKLNNKKDYLKLDNYEKNPELKYINHGWINWYDFLGINISVYPLCKHQWITECIKYNLTDDNSYNLHYEKYNLPSMPDELYKDFKSFYEEFYSVFRK